MLQDATLVVAHHANMLPLALNGIRSPRGSLQNHLPGSFTAIVYNVGLLPVICPRAGEITEQDQITGHFAEGYIDVSGRRLDIEPVPVFLQQIIDAGGLVEYAKTDKE